MKVFYTPKMVADSKSASPSASKPKLVVESWLRQNLPITVVEHSPVTVDQLSVAHDRKYVEDVLGLKRVNGFCNRSTEVAAALPYTTGSMLAAALHVLTTVDKTACAPCSGFHHAGWDTASGYCTFNGLMVTAALLHKVHGVNRIGILDCDQHYGNGTDAIIKRLDAKNWVTHYTAGKFSRIPSDAVAWLTSLESVVDTMADCDVVLYQAGADPHVDDPLGGGWLTTDQLRRRDAIVFDRLCALKIPVAWNLAGGYQVEPDGSIPKILEIHDNTARECIRAFER